MMKQLIFLSFAAAFVTLFPGNQCAAQISVDRAIVSFTKAQGDILNATVQNSGKEAVWIEGVVEAIDRSGFPDEKRVPTEDLVMSPKRFSIEAGGQRTIRLLLKKPLGETEQVYRIKFMPQAEEFNTEDMKNGSKTTRLKVIFSVGMLVFGEPLDPKPKLTWDRSGGKVTFRNEGNVNVLFDDIEDCAADGTGCRKIAGNRLYPGNVWEVPVSANRSLQLRKQTGSNFENMIIPAQ